MHELSIAMSLIDLAQEECSRSGARVVAIHLRLGPLSGVIREALESAYEMAREGTPLAEARLAIEETPVVGHCAACGREGRIESIQKMCCPACGEPVFDVRSGRELEVTALEVLDEAQYAHPGSAAACAQAE